MESKFNIYQIYYNNESFEMLDPGFVPLDNTNGDPSWFEFSAISSFFHKNETSNNSYYGFLSPKFYGKTGLSSEDLFARIQNVSDDTEVILINVAWDQIAYFLNPFEQGEYWHPGLIEITNSFLRNININFDVSKYYGHSFNTVFANFIIAKPKFWHKWLDIAERLRVFYNDKNSPLSSQLKSGGKYFLNGHQVQMKVFIQERIASLILASNPFVVSLIDISNSYPIYNVLFKDIPKLRNMLNACNDIKILQSLYNDDDLRSAYWSLRKLIQLKSKLSAE